MIMLFLNPLILMALVWAVSRKSAELEFSTMFFVSLGISLGSMAITHLAGEALGIFTLIPIAVLTAFLVMRFCYTSLAHAAIVAALFIATQIVLGLAVQALMGG